MYEFYYESETASGYVKFFAASLKEARQKAEAWAEGMTIEYVGKIAVNY